MTTESSNENATPIGEINEGPTKLEQFLDKHHKKIILIAAIATVGIASTYLYSQLQKNAEEAAGGKLLHAINASTPSEQSSQIKELLATEAGKKAAATGQVFLASAQWQNGERDAAIATLESFLASHPDHSAQPISLLKLSHFLIETKQSEKAKNILNQLLSDPNAAYAAPLALLTLGDLAANEGNIDEAKQFYERIKSDFSNSSLLVESTDSDSVVTKHLNALTTTAPQLYSLPKPTLPEGSELPANPGTPATPATPATP